MRFKVGDKVKFLNENGGGVVTGIVDSRLVKVETDGGFEMPVLSSELIPDFRATQSDEPVPTPLIPKTYPEPIQPSEKEEIQRVSEINPWGTIKEDHGVYLAYVPHEQQWVLTGPVDLVILNHTKYELLYNLYFEEAGSLRGFDYGSIPAGSKCTVDTFSRDEIEDRSKGFIQLMFHYEDPSSALLPVHSVVDIKPGRFFKEGNYRASTLLNDKALLLSIAPEATFKYATGSDSERKQDLEVSQGQPVQVKEKALIDKHRTSLFEAEVDLHIAELVDNISGLSNHDMFNIQLAYFRKTLESAILNDYRKITYIHGVGNGVLKNAIIKELEQYENTENKMASIAKFGVGALDVMIKNKE